MEKKYLLLCALAFTITTTYAANPATKEWVLQQIAANPPGLTFADWNAVCTAGSVTSSTGCYGNVNSTAFAKINSYVGGFTRYANINPQNLASSVFIKAFFGGANLPAQATNINVAVNASAARCALFTQEGFAIGPAGVNASVPTSGTDSGSFVPPMTHNIWSINNTAVTMAYNDFGPNPALSMGGPPNQDPIYLLCAGFNTTNGSTATQINVTAT